MHWTRWIVVGLLAFTGGWMTFDGSRALIVGDYITPRSGPGAGQLGPWSKVVVAIGLAPRSTLVKAIVAAYGILAIAAAAGLALSSERFRFPALAIAALGLWYAPIGSATNALVVVFLLFCLH